MSLHNTTKEWKLVQAALFLGLGAALVGAYLKGSWKPSDFLMTEPAPPQTPLLARQQLHDAVAGSRWGEALTLARRLKAASPNDRDLERIEAESLVQLRRFPEARDAYERLARRDPNDVSARLAAAAVRRQLGESIGPALEAIIQHPRATNLQRKQARELLMGLNAAPRGFGQPPPDIPAVPRPAGDPPWLKKK